MYIFWLSVLIAVLFALGDSSATRYFGWEQSWMWLVAGMLLNALGVVLFGYVAHRAWVADSSGLVLSLNIVLNIFLGALYFGDKLSPMQYVWLAFGIVGIVILSYY
jgi:uncharacterized membrane protein